MKPDVAWTAVKIHYKLLYSFTASYHWQASHLPKIDKKKRYSKKQLLT